MKGNETEAAYHAEIFDKLAAGKIDTWDYQVTFMLWANSGLAITPAVNLVSNIGYGGERLLHSHDVDSPYAAMQTFEIDHPLKHPPTVLRDLAADRMQYAALIEPVIRQARPSTASPPSSATRPAPPSAA